MRHIHALPEEKVPRDDEFKFRERAKALVDKWHDKAKANEIKTNGTRKAADVEDAGANGKADDTTKENGDKAEADVPMHTEEAPANGAGDESMLADVTMSEAA